MRTLLTILLFVSGCLASCNQNDDCDLCAASSACGNELNGLASAVTFSVQSDPAMRAFLAFKVEYQGALNQVSIEKFATRELWTGTQWSTAPVGTFPSTLIGSYESAFTFPTGEYLLSGFAGQSLRLVGKEFVLTISELFADSINSFTTRLLEPGWYYSYQQDYSGEGKFPGGSWHLKRKDIQTLYLDEVVFDLSKYHVVVKGSPEQEFSVYLNGQASCPSDAQSVVSEFPDVAMLLTLTYPPYEHTIPVEWMNGGR
jgi:hypothetical protein